MLKFIENRFRLTVSHPMRSMASFYIDNKIFQPDIYYIYYTGDVISHRVWNTSTGMNNAELATVFGTIAEYFPNTFIFPIVGNHEPHPLNA